MIKSVKNLTFSFIHVQGLASNLMCQILQNKLCCYIRGLILTLKWICNFLAIAIAYHLQIWLIILLCLLRTLNAIVFLIAQADVLIIFYDINTFIIIKNGLYILPQSVYRHFSSIDEPVHLIMYPWSEKLHYHTLIWSDSCCVCFESVNSYYKIEWIKVYPWNCRSLLSMYSSQSLKHV